jgi:uncharacterized protein YcgI (DUF1989 family)
MTAAADDLVTIPARHGVALSLRRGQEVVIVNTHGSQALDAWAFRSDDLGEHMSMEHSRSRLSKVTPRPGDTLVTTLRAPILTMTGDTSPGIHDTLLCACNASIYRELGCADDHRSCEANLHEALAGLGLELAWTPAPLNLFMNVSIGSDGSINRAPPASRPGDAVTFRAEMDLILVLSACPQDVTPINGADCTPREAQYAIR